MAEEKILLVDDDPDILELIHYNLAKEGYLLEKATNGREAIEVAKKFLPDLILLDVMMPGMDGVEACTEIREIPTLKNTIVAFLTARSEDYSQIAGFDAGADDYIAKPIKPKVLVARVKALLRRSALEDGSTFNNIGIEGLTIDKERYLVFNEDKQLSLPKKEFELLALLLSKPGRVFTREEILSQVWGSEVVVGDRTIDVHIRKLREKLNPELIITVKGVGYKLQVN
jgi:two-component system alkaline phosphatase synthesis response regulator PhoP